MNLKKKKRKESQKLVLGVEMYPYISAIYIIQKTKIMASSPITSQQIDGETVETLSDFILGGSKISADRDCSHKFKRCLLLGRKATANLDSIFKSRHYLAHKGPSSQSYGFSSSHVGM